MKTTVRCISIAVALAWCAAATGACGGNSNGGPADAGPDSLSYVTTTDAAMEASSASSSYTVPMNPLPGPVTVIVPDGSVLDASSGSSSSAGDAGAAAGDARDAAEQ